MNRATWVGALIAAGFTVLTIPAWVSTLNDPAHGRHTGAAAAIAVGYMLAAIAAAMLAGRAPTLGLRVTAVAVVTVLGGSLVALLGAGSASLLLWAICLMIALIPGRGGLVAAGVCLAGVAFHGWMTDSVDEMLPNLVILGSAAVAVALVVRLAEVHEELADARHALADLAVLQERERMSRELHDVLGSTATTVALKARLGATLVSRGSVEEAHKELVEIAGLATSMSRDVGAAVRDLRKPTLACELEAAAMVARSAGIRLDVRRLGEPHPDAEPALAMIIRESVTNAVKHAEANLVLVSVDSEGVTVTDDGRGGAFAEGNGIRSMRERLAARNGTLSITAADHGGTVVSARIP